MKPLFELAPFTRSSLQALISAIVAARRERLKERAATRAIEARVAERKRIETLVMQASIANSTNRRR